MSESFSTSSSVQQDRMHFGGPRRPDESDTRMDELDYELWHACAGPLTSLPPLGSVVMYWPQGHIEQVLSLHHTAAGSSNEGFFEVCAKWLQMIHACSDLILMCKCHMAPDSTMRNLEGVSDRASLQ